MQALERELGYRVFDRTSRGVTPTSRGRALLARIGGAMDAAVDAVAEATGAGATEHTVFLGGPAEFLSTVVLPRLREWAGTDLDVRVRFGETPELLAGLEASELDLVVSTTQPRMRGIEFAPLVDEQFVLVVAPALLDAFRRDPDSVPPSWRTATSCRSSAATGGRSSVGDPPDSARSRSCPTCGCSRASRPTASG